MTDPRLVAHRSAWQNKRAVRKIYNDYHRHLIDACVSGSILDVGSGSGQSREMNKDVVAIDLLLSPWVDIVGDAQALPFGNECLRNIIMMDVLHHIERPRAFFSEATRTLQKGGRLAMIEPAITPVSWLVYKFLHPEPVVIGIDPLAEVGTTIGRDPFDANQAIPSLIFARKFSQKRFVSEFPGLRILEIKYLSLFAYPLSGGFNNWSLIPSIMVSGMLAMERILMPILGRLMAFRLLVVLERV